MSEWWLLHAWSIAEVVVIGLVAGGVGSVAMMHRRIFFAEAVSHATFPGAVLGVVLGTALGIQHMSLWLFGGALAGCLVLALIMNALARLPILSSQAAAGIVLSMGFAFGYFWATWFQPLPVRVESFLTGSVLTVNRADVFVGVVVLAAGVALWCVQGPALVSLGFDRSSFQASGRSSWYLDLAVLALISATMVAAIPAMGTIVTIALVAAPAAVTQPFVSRPTSWVWSSTILGAGLGLVGLAIALQLELSVGGTIAVLSGASYAACWMWLHWVGKARR